MTLYTDIKEIAYNVDGITWHHKYSLDTLEKVKDKLFEALKLLGD